MVLLPSAVNTFATSLKCPAGQGAQVLGDWAMSQKLPTEQPLA